MSLRKQVHGQVAKVAKTVVCVLVGVTLVVVQGGNSRCHLIANPEQAAKQPPDKPQENPPDENKRGTPSIMVPTEGCVDVAFTQVRGYVIAREGDRVDHEVER